MTFYTTFTTADGIKAAYIYQTKRQLIAADQSGTFKAMQVGRMGGNEQELATDQNNI